MPTKRVHGRRRQVGRRLKILRSQAGLTLEEAAARMEWSSSKLGRWENGDQLTEIHGLKSLLDLYGVTADRWDEILDMCRAARQGGWWRAYGSRTRATCRWRQTPSW